MMMVFFLKLIMRVAVAEVYAAHDASPCQRLQCAIECCFVYTGFFFLQYLGNSLHREGSRRCPQCLKQRDAAGGGLKSALAEQCFYSRFLHMIEYILNANYLQIKHESGRVDKCEYIAFTTLYENSISRQRRKW